MGVVRNGLVETGVQPIAAPEVLGSEGAGRMCEEQEGGQGTQRMEGRDVTEPRRVRGHLGWS